MNRQSSSILCLWSAVFIVAEVLYVVESKINRGSTERSAYFQVFDGYVLDNHVVKTYQVTSALDCGVNCLRYPSCLSFNYKPLSNEVSECQLNDVNRFLCPECYRAEQDTIYYDDAQVNSCIGRDGELSNYDLYFPSKGVTSYVNQTWTVDMDEFTVCFWMQTNDSSEGVPFSYATKAAMNELTIFHADLTINNVDSDISLNTYYDGARHHVCARWENQQGSWNVTMDGTVINYGSGIKKAHAIPGGGYLTIGQEQDGTPGDPSGFAMKQSFLGSINGMNVWSKVLTDQEILRMSKTCNMGSGDVLKWSDFQVSRHGDVKVICPSACQI